MLHRPLLLNADDGALELAKGVAQGSELLQHTLLFAVELDAALGGRVRVAQPLVEPLCSGLGDRELLAQPPGSPGRDERADQGADCKGGKNDRGECEGGNGHVSMVSGATDICGWATAKPRQAAHHGVAGARSRGVVPSDCWVA